MIRIATKKPLNNGKMNYKIGGRPFSCAPVGSFANEKNWQLQNALHPSITKND